MTNHEAYNLVATMILADKHGCQQHGLNRSTRFVIGQSQFFFNNS